MPSFVYPGVPKEGPGEPQNIGIIPILIDDSKAYQQWRNIKDVPLKNNNFPKHLTIKCVIEERAGGLELTTIDKSIVFKGKKEGYIADYMIVFSKKNGTLFACTSLSYGNRISITPHCDMTITLPPALVILDSMSWTVIKELAHA